MGMDVWGRDPSSEVGEYFRNNIWHWFPLLEIAASTGVLSGEMVQGMSFNDGNGPDAETAKRLGTKLLEMVEGMNDEHYMMVDGQSMTEAAMMDIITQLDSSATVMERLRGTTIGNIREFAKFCQESGGFEVW